MYYDVKKQNMYYDVGCDLFFCKESLSLKMEIIW